MAGSASRDREFVRRAQAGDEDAFRILFESSLERLEDRVRKLVPAVLSRKLSVSDVLQDTRIAAFEHREEFDGERGPFHNWLLGIAENKARQAARRYGRTAKRRADREVSRGGRVDTVNFPGAGPTPSEVASTREQAERIREARASLTEDHAEILRLTYEEGLTLREAAERMGRSREAAKKLYGRALCRFRQAFRSQGNDGHGP